MEKADRELPVVSQPHKGKPVEPSQREGHIRGLDVSASMPGMKALVAVALASQLHYACACDSLRKLRDSHILLSPQVVRVRRARPPSRRAEHAKEVAVESPVVRLAQRIMPAPVAA